MVDWLPTLIRWRNGSDETCHRFQPQEFWGLLFITQGFNYFTLTVQIISIYAVKRFIYVKFYKWDYRKKNMFNLCYNFELWNSDTFLKYWRCWILVLDTNTRMTFVWYVFMKCQIQKVFVGFLKILIRF